MINPFYRILEELYSIFPESCLVCRNVLTDYTPSLVCNECLMSVVFSDLVSLDPFPTLSCIEYEHPVIRAVLTAIKFHNNRRVADAFSDLFLDKLKTLKQFPQEDFVFVPIPIHKNRLKQRGFNQVDCLFEPVACSLGIPFIPMLRRVKDTAPLFGLNPLERSKMISGAFVSDKTYYKWVSGKQIVIVDDIFTTGVSILEAASVLKDTGAKGILGFTLAKACP